MPGEFMTKYENVVAVPSVYINLHRMDLKPAESPVHYG